MNTKHTPEPWNTVSDANLGTLIRQEGLIIAKMRELEHLGIDHKANAARIVECLNALEGCTSEEIALIAEYVKKRDNNLMFTYAIEGKYSKTLHPVQQQLLDKYGVDEQIKKLSEEILELGIECQRIGYWESTIDEKFYREFLDVRNLMQQIESKLDPQLLEKYEAEMFEKIKTKYLDK